MSEAIEDITYCKFCEYVEHRDVLENNMLVNRIHTCKIVDISTETQYTNMYERTRNKQTEAYNEYMEKVKMILSLGIEEKKYIMIIIRNVKANNRQNIMISDLLYENI